MLRNRPVQVLDVVPLRPDISTTGAGGSLLYPVRLRILLVYLIGDDDDGDLPRLQVADDRDVDCVYGSSLESMTTSAVSTFSSHFIAR